MKETSFDSILYGIRRSGLDISSYTRMIENMITKGHNEKIRGLIDALKEEISDLSNLIGNLEKLC